MSIYKALLKYGYAAFRLEILEYCSADILIKREQFYLDIFKPKYNILRIAGSSLGFKHTEASKELMSKLAKGRIISPETVLKMKDRVISEELKSRISATLKGREITKSTRELISKALTGIKRSEDTVLKMAQGNQKRQPIILTNIETGISKEFSFMKDAAKYLGTSHTQIRNYLNKNKSFKGHSIYLGKVKK
jgi:group I intron endonuclease